VQVKCLGAKAVDRKNGLIVVEVELDNTPDSMWISFFRSPKKWDTSIHPSGIDIRGNKLIVTTPESTLDREMKWVKKYVEYANEKYEEYEKNKHKEGEKEDREDLKEISDKLKNLF